MYAAVVTDFSLPPRFDRIDDPVASGDDEIVVEVLASALHPRVRSQADGSHYTATEHLPLVPGVDGVGRDADGALRYFVVEEGAMAQRAVIDRRASLVLPDGLDPVTIAAAMNPAMSSWLALRRRADLQPGQHVVILGATGSAGRMAIEVARHLGAGRVSAVARDTTRFAALEALGADEALGFDRIGEVAGADVVLDYVWGAPGAAAMTELVRARPDRSEAFTWVQIGSVAGPEAPVLSAALRSSGLRIVGSGQGSVPTRDILEELRPLAAYIGTGAAQVDARALPLSEVAEAWATPASSAERLVLVP